MLSIFAILYDHPYNYFDEIQVKDVILNSYVGEYEVNPDYHIRVTLAGNKLFIERPNEPKIELIALKDDVFFEREEDVMIYFNLDAEKNLKITITQGLSTKKGDKIIK